MDKEHFAKKEFIVISAGGNELVVESLHPQYACSEVKPNANVYWGKATH